MAHISIPPQIFATIVEHTPLVSVDLVLTAPDDRVLLGRRVNEPARGWWFVPGGRIKKGEAIAQAIARVGQAELGIDLTLEKGQFLGAYEHFYDTSAVGGDVGTHYVALGWRFAFGRDHPAGDGSGLVADAQHEELRWWPRAEAIASEAVHAYTKAYLME
jgi:colanic acid biosynthesis protein WcaH